MNSDPKAALKICCTCNVALPADNFNRTKSRSDGLYPSCRPCAKRLALEAAARRGEKALAAWKERKTAYDKERYAGRREIVQAECAAYYRANRDAYIKSAAEWRIKNPERRRAISKSYKGRRKSVERTGISGTALMAWTNRQAKVCYWCSVRCDGKFHVDHYQPLARGGLHVESNLVIACPTCNLNKHAMDPIKFAHRKGRLF
jgi:5-methylcytosine-specific restriction endonuclease McrA